MSGHDVVFYDGVCGLCDRIVHFLLRRDRAGRFRFAPLQGPAAQRLLVPRGGRPDDLDTVYVLRADGVLLMRSRAILHAVAVLGGGWRLLGVLRVVPAPLLDLVYRVVAALRYRIFGRLESCQVPSADERHRFLEAALEE